jgi:uncharacterized membrane protein
MSDGGDGADAGIEKGSSGTASVGAARRWAAMTLAAVGLCISGYLAWLSLTGRVAPGCGSGAGCGEVLGSRWSAIGPVPVSLLAASGYTAILVLLLIRPWRLGGIDRWLGVLGALGVTLILAAGWYIFLQAKVIGAWCSYCMGGHLVGVVLGLLLFLPTLRFRIQWAWALLLGYSFLGLLLNLQFNWPATTPSVALPAGQDYDLTDATGRHLGLLGGALQLDAIDTPHHGTIDGEDAVVVVLDYACPHCREAHEMLDAALAEREGLVVFALPASLHEDHNPHLPLDHERFDHSYELALLSLAVWRAAPEQWPAFDRWLFEGNARVYDETRWPRTFEAAESRAAGLIGRDAVAGAYADPDLRARVERNIHVIGDVLAASPHAAAGLPIVLAPHADEAMYGRFDEPGLLDDLLDTARANR